MTAAARVESLKDPAAEPVEHPTLAAALAAFQAEVPSIKKGNTATVPTKAGGQYTYEYADLADVTEQVLPLLGKHGLSFSSKPTLVMLTPDTEAFRLAYVLRHAGSGEVDEGMYPLPDPRHETPQNLGAALTYARRYVLCAVTGVAPGGDDTDAHQSEAQSRPASSGPRQGQDQPSRRRDPARPTPDQPLPTPKPTQDWSGLAAQADTVDALGAVRNQARDAGELFLEHAAGETVEAMFLRRRGILVAQEQRAAEGKAEAPKAGTKDAAAEKAYWVGQARKAESRAELRNTVVAAADKGMPKSVLNQMAEFEEALPETEAAADDWPVAAPGSGAPKPLTGDKDE
jgi:ERF superfamily